MVTLKIHAAREQQPVDESSLFHQWIDTTGSPWVQFWRVDNATSIRFIGIADFRVPSHSLDVEAWPAPGVVEESCRQLFHSQVRSLALSHAGHLVLHASAVELGAVAVAFLAQSGGGKSTLAASFTKDGDRLMVDDGVQIERGDGGYIALPGDPSFRLWEDSEAELVTDDTPIAPSAGYTYKRRFLGGGAFAFCDEARPLARIYLLGEDVDASLSITPLLGRAALLPLLEHCFVLDVDDRAARALQMKLLAQLVICTPVFRLDYPRNYAALPEVRRAIRKHAAPETDTPT